MPALTYAQRKKRLTKGSLKKAGDTIGETRRFMSNVFCDRAQKHDVDRVKRAQVAIAKALGVPRIRAFSKAARREP